MKNFIFCLLFVLWSGMSWGQSGVLTLVTRPGLSGFSGDGGPATNARFTESFGIGYAGGDLYIADRSNNRIRKIDNYGIVTTVAGNGLRGYSGDGGYAIDAELNWPHGVTVDRSGNLYIADNQNHVVRKINTLGIISTIAGTGISGYSGDGGMATLAKLYSPSNIAIDQYGNLYIADDFTSVVRKITPAGIITTIAGNGTRGYSGDGGPATLAALSSSMGVAIDMHGNVYISELGNNRIRKIDPSGIINTFAGIGIAGFSGDGGPATAAAVNWPWNMAIDDFGNVYFTDNGNDRIRKINTLGIISTIAGNGELPTYFEGVPATSVGLSSPTGIVLGISDEIYFASQSGFIQKITRRPDIRADRFGVSFSSNCNGIDFSIETNHFSPDLRLLTLYGDGKRDTNTFSNIRSIGHVSFHHPYSASGNYTIKHVLMNGAVPLDSVTYSQQFKFCNIIFTKVFLDKNNNCNYDSSTESDNSYPVTTVVDSNGVAIDTFSAISGYYYKAYGPPGTVYNFRSVSTSPGLRVSCPWTSIVSDTIPADGTFKKINLIGLSCNSSRGVELAINSKIACGRHQSEGTIIVNNYSCSPHSATVTMKVDPKYIFTSSLPAPSSVTGNIVKWNLPNLFGTNKPTKIMFHLDVPNAWDTVRHDWDRTHWLFPGETIVTHIGIASDTTEADTTNNNETRVDTVKSSYDPNEIEVSPTGLIIPCTQLQYTIHFENMGNDTAHNIHVMDTLSDNVDIRSLELVMASDAMDIAIMKESGHNVVKFDFPNIKLPDSSHHNQCTGMVIFKIKAKNGLPDGTSIINRAGIYFDDNEVVMTNAVGNIIGMAPITGPDTVCVGGQVYLQCKTQGGNWAASNTTATIVSGLVTGAAAGADTINYVVSNACVTRASTKTIHILPTLIPFVTITTNPTAGTPICEGAQITLTAHTTNGGTAPAYLWQVNNATVGNDSTYSYTPNNADIVIATLTSNANCLVQPSATATDTITVVAPIVPAVNISAYPGLTISAGQVDTFVATVTNGGTAPVYQWMLNGTVIANQTAAIYMAVGLANNDSVTCMVSNGDACGAAVSSSVKVTVADNINPLPSPTLNPNPNKGEFTLSGSLGAGFGNDRVLVTIRNTIGQVVYKSLITTKNGVINEKISLSPNMARGMYVLAIRHGGGNKLLNFVIE